MNAFIPLALLSLGALFLFGFLLNISQESATQKASSWLTLAVLISAAAAIIFAIAIAVSAIIGAFQ